jgi:hypothetical protein
LESSAAASHKEALNTPIARTRIVVLFQFDISDASR